MAKLNIDLSSLTAAELDDLIAAAGKRRANLKPYVSPTRPDPVEALINPSWYVDGLPVGSLLQIRHTAFGWLSFLIPSAERDTLLSLLRRQADASQVEQSGTAPAGDAVH